MSDQVPLCPEYGSEHAYPLGALLVCPMCGHEWAPDDPAGESDGDAEGDGPRVITDAVHDEDGNRQSTCLLLPEEY